MKEKTIDEYLIIYKKIIEHVSKLMEDEKSDDWETRYKGYLKLLSPNSDKSKLIKKLQSAIHVEKPLTKYLSISCADETTSNKAVYDIRVFGHSIGHLIIELNTEIKNILKQNTISSEDKKILYKLIEKNRRFSINIKDSKGYTSNYNAFNYLIGYLEKSEEYQNKLKKWVDNYLTSYDKNKRVFDWNGEEMRDLRRIFQNSKDILKIGSEHSCENLLLRKLAEKDGKIKYIKNIQPVKIASCGFFQMPTCIGGSKHNDIKYSGCKGGGIDILAKIKKEGNKPSELCVIEIKDEYKNTENPRIAMQQAIAYAVCLDYILRKANTEELNWYQVLTGSKRKIPDSININVVVAMPFPLESDNIDISKDKALAKVKVPPINISGHNDTLTLHYMFFKKEALKNDNVPNGIIASFDKDIKK